MLTAIPFKNVQKEKKKQQRKTKKKYLNLNLCIFIEHVVYNMSVEYMNMCTFEVVFSRYSTPRSFSLLVILLIFTLDQKFLLF